MLIQVLLYSTLIKVTIVVTLRSLGPRISSSFSSLEVYKVMKNWMRAWDQGWLHETVMCFMMTVRDKSLHVYT